MFSVQGLEITLQEGLGVDDMTKNVYCDIKARLVNGAHLKTIMAGSGAAQRDYAW